MKKKEAFAAFAEEREEEEEEEERAVYNTMVFMCWYYITTYVYV